MSANEDKAKAIATAMGATLTRLYAEHDTYFYATLPDGSRFGIDARAHGRTQVYAAFPSGCRGDHARRLKAIVCKLYPVKWGD